MAHAETVVSRDLRYPNTPAMQTSAVFRFHVTLAIRTSPRTSGRAFPIFELQKFLRIQNPCHVNLDVSNTRVATMQFNSRTHGSHPSRSWVEGWWLVRVEPSSLGLLLEPCLEPLGSLDMERLIRYQLAHFGVSCHLRIIIETKSSRHHKSVVQTFMKEMLSNNSSFSQNQTCALPMNTSKW